MTLLRRDSSAPARRYGERPVEGRRAGSSELQDAMGEVKACLHYNLYDDGSKMGGRRRATDAAQADANRPSTALERAKKDFEQIDKEVTDMEQYLFGADALARHQHYVDSRVKMTGDDKRLERLKHDEGSHDVVEYNCIACADTHRYDWKFDAMPYSYGMRAIRKEGAKPPP